MAESFPTGRFVWYELLARSQDAATEFYLPVTGWTTEVWEGSREPYTMWMNGPRPVGGIMILPEEARAQGAPPHWLAYVATPDVEETLNQALELGAQRLAGIMEVPTVGKMAVLKDPQGALFAAYTPDAVQTMEEGGPSIGEFSWHELLTSDPEAAFQFYQRLFGWERTGAVDMGEMGTYQMYGRPGEGFSLGGIYKTPPQIPAPPHWLPYIMVPDIGEALNTVRNRGGTVVSEPREVPGGDLIAQCTDPEGAPFALHQVSGSR